MSRRVHGGRAPGVTAADDGAVTAAREVAMANEQRRTRWRGAMHCAWVRWSVAAVLSWGLGGVMSCRRSLADLADHERGQDGAAVVGVPPGAPSSHDSHQGHAHPEESDLDLPLEALFAARCEHSRLTHQCDECRYEVGVVKVPERLFEEGLLRRGRIDRRPVPEQLRLTGEIGYDERRIAHVSVPAEGILRRVRVALGDAVAPGALLAEVDSVVGSEAAVEANQARSQLELARLAHERQRLLHEQGITAEREYLVARQAHEAAQLRLAGAQRRLSELGAGAGGSLALRAPVAGTVLELHAVAGELARPGDVLFIVGDHDALWIWADVYERDVAAVLAAHAAGPLPARIAVRAYPGRDFEGTVDWVQPRMDPHSRTMKLRIGLRNAERVLLVGMFADVRLLLPGTGTQRVLVAPRAAVLEDEGRQFVFVRHGDGYYVRRAVESRRVEGDWIEIQGDLQRDQEVVTEGAFLLKSDVLRAKMGAGCAD